MLFNKRANPSRILIRGIVSIVVGITIIAVPGLTINLIIQFLGGLFIIDGLINLITNLIQKAKQTKIYTLVPRGIGNLILGAILFMFPAFMTGIFVFLIGFILIIAGGSLLVTQIGGRNFLGFSWLIFIISLIAFFAGVVMLSNPFKSSVTIIIFFGAIIAIYGAGEVVWSLKLRKYQKQNPTAQSDVIDAEYEEVD